MSLARVARSLPLQRERLTHPEDLHITLAFLGMVEAERLPCVLAAAERVRGEPFSLQLDHLDYWPRSKVAWLGPEETPPALTQLVNSLWKRLEKCGFQREPRAYQPHATLARKGGDIERGKVEPALLWEVGDFVLMESLSVREPPRYKVLRRWSLVPNQD